jgi:hypothetical protein
VPLAWMRAGSPVAPQMLEVYGRKSFLTARASTKAGALIGEQALLAARTGERALLRANS